MEQRPHHRAQESVNGPQQPASPTRRRESSTVTAYLMGRSLAGQHPRHRSNATAPLALPANNPLATVCATRQRQPLRLVTDGASPTTARVPKRSPPRLPRTYQRKHPANSSVCRLLFVSRIRPRPCPRPRRRQRAIVRCIAACAPRTGTAHVLSGIHLAPRVPRARPALLWMLLCRSLPGNGRVQSPERPHARR